MNSAFYFLTEGYKKPYKLIFGSPQFPFWFSVQCLYSCYIVSRSTIKNKLSFGKVLKTLLCSSLMTFAPRELFAYLFHKKSPIQNNQQILIIYAVIYLLMTLSPFNIFYKLVNLFGYVLSMIQGANQVRLLTLILRVTKNDKYSLLIANIFTFMDLVIEIVLRPLYNGENTDMSSPGIIFKGFLFSTFYDLLTNRNRFTIYIGIYQHYVPALLLALCFATINSSAYLRQVLSNKKKIVEQKKKEEKEKEEKEKNE